MSASFTRSKRAALRTRAVKGRQRPESGRKAGEPAGLRSREIEITVVRCRRHAIPRKGCIGCTVAQQATLTEIALAAGKAVR